MPDGPQGDLRALTVAAPTRRGVLVAVVLGLVMAATTPLSTPAGFVVIAVAVVLGVHNFGMLFAPSDPRGVEVSSGDIIPWATIFVAFCLWEVAALQLGNDADHPTFSTVAEPVMAWPPTRALVATGWVLVGLAFFERLRVDAEAAA